jgi:hypothetical protein
MKVGNAETGFSDNVCMPLRLVIPLPGPLVYVSGGRRGKPTQRIAGFTPGSAAFTVLALGALIYGVVHVWWIAAIVGALVLTFAVAVFRANTTKGHRTDFVRALWGRTKQALHR